MKNILLFLFILTNFVLYSKELDFYRYDPKFMQQRVWTSKNGLPSNTITDIIQDKKGYIWIGTYNGLVRFDGIKFLTYNKNNFPNFKANSARVLCEDSIGNIWIGTNSEGLIKLSDNKIETFTIKNGLSDNSIRSIHEDKKKTLWIGTTKGLCSFKNGVFKRYLNIENLKNSTIEFIYEDTKSNIWIGTDRKTLYIYNNETFTEYKPNKNLSSYIFTDILEAKDGKYWFATKDDGIFVLGDDYFKHYTTKTGFLSDKINKLYQDKFGGILIATDKGFLRYYKSKFSKYSEEDGLNNNMVDSIIIDIEGSIWLGTSRGGLTKLSKGKFLNYTKDEGLCHNKVNSIIQSEANSFLIGTDLGLSYMKDGNFINNDLTKLLKGLRIRHIFQDSKKRIWFSTYNKDGLVLYDKGKIKLYNKKNQLTGNRIRIVFEDSRGEIWIGTTNGLNQYNNGKIKQYTRKDGLSNDYIMCINEDFNGDIILGTDGGGLNLLKSNGIEVLSAQDGLLGNVIFKIYKDNNALWIASNEGISRFYYGRFKNFSMKDGLHNDAIFQIIEDKQGMFWLGHSKGISVISKQKLENYKSGDVLNFKLYDESDGLKSGITPTSWGSLDKSGKIWFPTLEGLAIIDPQNILINKFLPNVLLEKIKIDNEFYKPNIVKRIEPGKKRITFDFTALSFIVPEKIKFQYKLDGFEKKWSDSTYKREASYTNLAPGKYTFRVRAANNDGLWSLDDTNTSFIQEPYFYQTIFFKVIIFFLFLLLIILFYRIRLKQLIKNQIILEKKIEERTKDLKIEKEKSDKLLLNILPSKVANELKNYGKTEPTLYKNVTVCFCDIVNFTKLSSKLDPKYLIEELNEIFTAFDKIMKKNNGERIKTIGDAYLAVSGMPETNENHAEDIIKSGIEMLSFLKERNKTAMVKWKIRIGIHSGEVIGGVVGVEKYIYDVFGDTINTVSRIESYSETMKINISQFTYRLLRGKFEFEEREDIQVKGKGIMKMYFLK